MPSETLNSFVKYLSEHKVPKSKVEEIFARWDKEISDDCVVEFKNIKETQISIPLSRTDTVMLVNGTVSKNNYVKDFQIKETVAPYASNFGEKLENIYWITQPVIEAKKAIEGLSKTAKEIYLEAINKVTWKN